MRVIPLTLALLLSLLTSVGYAAEPVLEPHAMIYYQIPFGGKDYNERRHSFGFRMDRAVVEPTQYIDYQRLIKQPALLDIKMGRDGIDAMMFAGVDYLKKFRVYQASAGGQEPSETGQDEIPQEEPVAEESPEDQSHIWDGPVITDIFGDATLGIAIGLVLAIGFLATDIGE